MKRETIKKLIAVAGCVTLFCAIDVSVSAAATTASAATSGDVVAAITINKTADLSFGRIIAGSSASKVTLAPSTGNRTVDTGNAETAGGTVTVASFTITGDGSNQYNVTLPGTFDVSDGNSHTMAVDTVAADQALTNLTGTKTIKVGATLNVGATQASGSYTSANGLQISVAYQ